METVCTDLPDCHKVGDSNKNANIKHNYIKYLLTLFVEYALHSFCTSLWQWLLKGKGLQEETNKGRDRKACQIWLMKPDIWKGK